MAGKTNTASDENGKVKIDRGLMNSIKQHIELANTIYGDVLRKYHSKNMFGEFDAKLSRVDFEKNIIPPITETITSLFLLKIVLLLETGKIKSFGVLGELITRESCDIIKRVRESFEGKEVESGVCHG